MRSRNAKLTVVAIVLLLGAPQVNAEDAAASPGNSPFAQLRGFQPEAAYSGYVGDDSELQMPPEVAAPVSEAAFDYDLPKVGYGKSQKSGKKGGQELSVKDGEADQPMVYGPWIGFEYMSTWLEGRYLPPLVTSGNNGVLPGADILFGGDEVGSDRQPAGKLSLGAWLGPAERLGVGGNFFMVETETVPFSRGPLTGNPMLAQPIFDTSTIPPAVPGPWRYPVTGVIDGVTLTGDIQAATQTDVLGAEGYLRYLLFCAPGRRIDLIGGYQFSRVDDSLQIASHTNYQGFPFAVSFEAEDVFDAVNKFHGGELGLLGEFGKGPIMLSVLAKVGLGNMNEVVTIAGRSSATAAGGGTAYYNGGILALPTNMGVYEEDEFAVIPELDAKLIFKLTRHLELSVGYNFIYWSTLALAGDQIDTSMGGLPTVNSSQWFGGTLDPAGGSHPALDGIKTPACGCRG